MTNPTHAHNVTGRGRHYTDPDTRDDYPSVSNVIGILDKPAIRWWHVRGALRAAWESKEAFARMADPDQAIDAFKSAPYKSSGKKADLGSAVHAICAALSSDDPLPDVPAEAEGHCDQFLEFVAAFDVTVLAAEQTVMSREYGYAGTFDCLASLAGERWLLDLKTGSGVYDETALQLAAYRHADTVLHADGSTSPWEFDGRCAAVHLSADSFRLVPVDTSRAVFEAFLGCRAAWEFAKGAAGDDVVLPEVEAPGVPA